MTQAGILGSAGRHLEREGIKGRLFIISSRRVWRLWGAKLREGLEKRDLELILIEDEERWKNLENVQRIWRKMARAGGDRSSTVIAFGGGVLGDVAGFAASCYMRGVGLVHIPTTLTGQIDSAIGGKTGVNLPEGKNLAGAFHSPRFVLVDPQTLATLPARQFNAGMYEAVKYGVALDAELFERLEKQLRPGTRMRGAELDWVIRRCQAAKARVASEDEREEGPRALLNFGHTTGHAIEGASRFRRYLHGEAVGWGMMVATLVATGMKRLEARDGARILRLIGQVGRLPELRGISLARVREMMRRDKKRRNGRAGWVVPVGIGKAEYGVDAPEMIVEEALGSVTALYEGLRRWQ